MLVSKEALASAAVSKLPKSRLRPLHKAAVAMAKRSRHDDDYWICGQCAVQVGTSVSDAPPEQCKICEDERQYVGPSGQSWTTRAELLRKHRTVIRDEEFWVLGIGVEPAVGIGQRSLLIKTAVGNVLWDAIPLLDDEAKHRIDREGGVKAIALSHPHFLGACVDIADAFDAPIYVCMKDREWISRPSSRYILFQGPEQPLFGGIKMINLGGHFRGSCILHWKAPDGKGVIATGDTIQFTPRAGNVSFMYSYPNFIPLPASQVERIRDAVKPLEFDRLHGGWFGKSIKSGAHEAVISSADRYIGILRETLPGYQYF